MPNLEPEKHYGFRKGRYAVESHPHNTRRDKRYRIVDTELGETVTSWARHSWDFHCETATKFDKKDPVMESTFVPSSGTCLKTNDDLPPVRVMGQGDPF